MGTRLMGVLLANDASLYDREHEGDGGVATLENCVPESPTLINEVAIDERGWAVIPFGDWPHEMGMQKFHVEQAKEIVDSFNGLAGRFRRAIVGLPIFKGHPDHPVAAIANTYPDKEEKGQIAAMEVRPNGLALKLVLSNAGAELVRKGWKFISPMWIGQLISKAGEAFRTYAPTEMRSVGLVVRPNIPSPSLANAASAANSNKNKTMNPETLKLLGLAADATPEQIDTAVKAMHGQASSLANEQSAKTTAEGKVTILETKVTTLENAATAAATTLTEAQTALANERTARINDVLADAIRRGRCTEAEKAVWKGRLEANFAAESVALANAAPKVKTESEIPGMLKALETQMKKGLANANTDADKSGASQDSITDDGKDECGFANSDYEGMDAAARQGHMKTAVAKEKTALGNGFPAEKMHNTAFANAKKKNPRLFAFQPKAAD